MPVLLSDEQPRRVASLWRRGLGCGRSPRYGSRAAPAAASDHAPCSKSGRRRDPPGHPRARRRTPAVLTPSPHLSTQDSALSTPPQSSVLIPPPSALRTRHSALAPARRPPSSINTVKTTIIARFPETRPLQFARNSLSPAQLRRQTPSPNSPQPSATRPNQRTFRRIQARFGRRNTPPPPQLPPNAASSHNQAPPPIRGTLGGGGSQEGVATILCAAPDQPARQNHPGRTFRDPRASAPAQVRGSMGSRMFPPARSVNLRSEPVHAVAASSKPRSATTASWQRRPIRAGRPPRRPAGPPPCCRRTPRTGSV